MMAEVPRPVLSYSQSANEGKYHVMHAVQYTSASIKKQLATGVSAKAMAEYTVLALNFNVSYAGRSASRQMSWAG